MAVWGGEAETAFREASCRRRASGEPGQESPGPGFSPGEGVPKPGARSAAGQRPAAFTDPSLGMLLPFKAPAGVWTESETGCSFKRELPLEIKARQKRIELKKNPDSGETHEPSKMTPCLGAGVLGAAGSFSWPDLTCPDLLKHWRFPAFEVLLPGLAIPACGLRTYLTRIRWTQCRPEKHSCPTPPATWLPLCPGTLQPLPRSPEVSDPRVKSSRGSSPALSSRLFPPHGSWALKTNTKTKPTALLRYNSHILLKRTVE